jgi:predicted transcriptional regulator
MKAIKVKIGFENIESSLKDFVKVGETIIRGEQVRKHEGVYFMDYEAFRKASTPKRLELLRIIKEQKPVSIHQLAKLAHRDIKNVHDDVRYLAQIGLVELSDTGTGISCCVGYDKIELEILV